MEEVMDRLLENEPWNSEEHRKMLDHLAERLKIAFETSRDEAGKMIIMIDGSRDKIAVQVDVFEMKKAITMEIYYPFYCEKACENQLNAYLMDCYKIMGNAFGALVYDELQKKISICYVYSYTYHGFDLSEFEMYISEAICCYGIWKHRVEMISQGKSLCVM